MVEEIWKYINGFENRYEVSSFGRVRSWYKSNKKLEKPHYKKPQKNKNGYYYVILYKNGVIKSFQLHRLILTVFDKKMPSNIDCCHIDDDKENNNIGNLKWGTRKENEHHKKINGNTAIGERNGLSKLKNTQIVEIRKLYKQGMSTNKIAKLLNLKQQNVWNICLNKTWKHIKI